MSQEEHFRDAARRMLHAARELERAMHLLEDTVQAAKQAVRSAVHERLGSVRRELGDLRAHYEPIAWPRPPKPGPPLIHQAPRAPERKDVDG